MNNSKAIAKLRELRARIASLPEVRAKIAKRVAEEFSKLARQDFDARTTPDGEPWKAGKGGKPVAHNRTGRLERAATAYTSNGRRIRASVGGVPYARYQRPGDFMPRRLPVEWAERVRQIAREEITAHMRGAS